MQTRKTTTCQGTFLNAFDGSPIKDFLISLNSTRHASAIDSTDINGQYFLEIVDEWEYSADLSPVHFFDATTQVVDDFFIPLFSAIEAGQSNTVDLRLDPKDAILRIHLLNESVLNGSIYGFTSSPTSEKNNQIVNLPHFPIEVPLNDSIEFQFKVAGGECSDVFFYTLGKEEKNVPEATVFCLRNDTTDVWVSF